MPFSFSRSRGKAWEDGEQGTALLEHDKIEVNGDADQMDPDSRARWMRSKTTAYRLLLSASIFLIPSFITARLFPDRAMPPSKLHKTSYLDGLRGVAAVSVAIFHFTNAIYNNTGTAWGVKDEFSVMKLPFIRLIYAGPFAVSLFFVISGFALSIKPVEYMFDHSHDHKKLFKTLTSSTFRRPVRLYVPAWGSALLVLCVLMTGVMDSWGFKDRAKDVKAPPPKWPPIGKRDQIPGQPIPGVMPGQVPGVNASPVHELSAFQTAELLIVIFFKGCMNMLQVFNTEGPAEKLGHPFNSPLWSIVVEFRASILLFIVQLGLATVRRNTRLLLTLLLMFLSVYSGTWEMVLFLGGFGLAQLEHIFPAFEAKLRESPRRYRLWSGFLVFNLVIGLYFGSYPDYLAGDAPLGYSLITKLVPSSYGNEKARFWQGIGSIQIVFALSRMPSIAAIFATRPIRYIGQISFSLYLVHSMVLVTWGVTILSWVWMVTGRDDPFMNGVGFVISVLFLLPAIMWLADIFWRAVDLPSVTLARWIESKCTGEE